MQSTTVSNLFFVVRDISCKVRKRDLVAIHWLSVGRSVQLWGLIPVHPLQGNVPANHRLFGYC